MSVMDIIERVKADVATGPRGRITEIAEGSGVKVKTLRNLIYGETQDMKHANARKLMDYYAQNERRTTPDRRNCTTVPD